MIKIKTQGELKSIALNETSSKIRILLNNGYLVNAVEVLQLKECSFTVVLRGKYEGEAMIVKVTDVILKNISINDSGESKIDLNINPEQVNLQELNCLLSRKGNEKILDIIIFDKLEEKGDSNEN